MKKKLIFCFSIENETTALKESVAKLEAEKKANNFGKVEKDKLKNELEKATANVQKFQSSIDSLTREKTGLSKKIEEMTKGGEKTKEELHQKNADLISKVAQIESKLKETESQLNSEYQNKLSSLESNYKSQIQDLTADCAKYQKDLREKTQEWDQLKSSSQSEKSKTSENLTQVEKQLSQMKTEKSNLQAKIGN